jgi:hypothetical protein
LSIFGRLWAEMTRICGKLLGGISRSQATRRMADGIAGRAKKPVFRIRLVAETVN